MTIRRLARPATAARRFRLATPADEDAIRALTDAAYAPYLPVLGGKPGPMTEAYAPRIRDGQVHLAVVAGVIVGLLVLERGPDHALIFSVAVRPDRQGEGHGRALLAQALEQARLSGVAELRLYTNVLMTRNIALYRRLGFRETGRRPHPRRANFTVVDMARPVRLADP